MQAQAAERLGKLLRLLSSDKDGEVLAAVYAIRKTLESEKSDIHALADTISLRVSRAPSWHEIAVACERKCTAFKPHEQEFIQDMVRKTVNDGELSEKQTAWLRALYVRCRRW